MRRTIAIGMLGLALVANRAAAQTAVEQARILSGFQRSVAEYTRRVTRLDLFPKAITAATAAPKVFTPPVAMVFRQLIAKAISTPDTAIGAVSASHRATVLQPFPTTELVDFPKVLSAVLPALPPPLEYRLIDHDLVIRDAEADIIVAVLRDALGTAYTRH